MIGGGVDPDSFFAFAGQLGQLGGAGFAGPAALGVTSGVKFVGPHNLVPPSGNGKVSRTLSPSGGSSGSSGKTIPIKHIGGGVTHQHHQKAHLTEDTVTRANWQRETGNDRCSDYKCRTQLNARTGKGNCRSCGRLYCDDHLSCQMKLDKKAQWDPQHGVWCRVCFSCFESRPGFNDASGLVNDITYAFVEKRKRTITKSHLEVNLLEKRLSRLLKFMIDTNDPSVEHTSSVEFNTSLGAAALAKGAAGLAASYATSYYKQVRNYRRPPEQQIVAWQDDNEVQDCPYCERKFTFSVRKHHCRLCGKVVCGEEDTACSIRVALDSAALTDYLSEKVDDDIVVKVRVCKDCHSIVFGRREFADDVAEKITIVKVYVNMIQFKKAIETLLPRFQRLLTSFDDPDHPPSHEVMTEATEVRKKLIHNFQQYDTAAKRIWGMPTKSAQQAKLQANIHMAAMQVLQMYMLPLKSLPNALKHGRH
ncbi:FYVE zinc finger-domain-containing protein [Limtongia smithiae]|uniref:FYVE zinc finger-domain-containing protein n=1 Tax=Limtongia smithiae TaxID=1125753 RepID=UPI0034CFB6DA